MSPNPDHSSTCPRCGGPLPHAATGGVCLRCAGLRVLNLESSGVGHGVAIDGSAERAGPYVVIEELGRGGMGRVVAACQPGLGRIVAVKTIRAGVDPELDLRFLREVQTLSRLRHPHIVAIHDSGQTPDSLYFSMDYIEGGDLATRLRGGALHPREAVPLLRKVANALAYLHGQGVLHRDLKPSNILLDGIEPKLADFGLAAQLDAGGDLTALTRVLGTPHYLAPEALLRGSAAYSVTGDIYSFGVIFYELLTGRTPFAGASPEGLLNLVQHSEPPAPRLLVPSLPRDLEVICLKCLDRDPAKRYATATALEEDLVRFQTGQPILARPLSRIERLLRWTRRRPELAAIWVLVFALAAGATTAAVRVAREQTRTADALAEAREANALARDRLRDARLAEAKAVVHTTNPGRRAQALAAVREAAAIRPGVDLRDAALAALTTIDLEATDTWDLHQRDPAEVELAPNGEVAATRTRSPSGLKLENQTIHLQRRGQTESLGTIETPAPILGPLSFSADGHLLAARLEDASLRIWSTNPPAPVLTLNQRGIPGPWPRPDQNADYAISPSGRLLAAGRPAGGIDLVSIPDGQTVATWPGPRMVQSLQFSPDERWIAATRIDDPAARSVALLDAHTAQLLAELPCVADIQGLVWSPDSRRIGLLAADTSCSWFTIPDGRLLQHVNRPCGYAIHGVALAQDDLLVLNPFGDTLQVVQGNSSRLELSLAEVGSSKVSTADAGRAFFAISISNVVTRWRPTPRPGWQIVPSAYTPSTGYGMGPRCFDISPDGNWTVTADGNHLVVYNRGSPRPLALFPIDPRAAMNATVAFSADGSHLWRTSTFSGSSLHRFQPSPDGSTASIGPAEPVDPSRGFVISDVSADRRTLALVGLETGTIKVQRLAADGTPSERAEWATPDAYAAALSPDARLVLVNCSGTGPDGVNERIRIFRTADGSLAHELPAAVRCEAAWNADGTTAMTSNGTDTSIVWNTADWSPRCTIRGHLGGDATTFGLSADGRTALILRDGRAHLISTRDGTRVVTLALTDALGFCLGIREISPGVFAAVQADFRIDVLDTNVWNAELTKLGLGW